MIEKISALFLFVVLFACSGFTQDKLSVKFRSRGLFDACLDNSTGKTENTFYVEDFRAGFKAVYGRFEIKADVGFNGSKAGFKDLLFSYNTAKHTLTIGNGYEPFAVDMLISTYDLRMNQSASSVLAFSDSRKIGITYYYHTAFFYAAGGVYTDNDINKLSSEKQRNAYAFTGRAVVRPVVSDRTMLHLGVAASHRTKDADARRISIGSYGVSAHPGAKLAGADIENVSSLTKGAAELMLYRGNFFVQGEYMMSSVCRTAGRPFLGHGGYVYFGYTLRCKRKDTSSGRNYGYDFDIATPERPPVPSAAEFVVRYNYLDLNDARSRISGGSEHDVSLAVNYYFNKYMAVKWSTSYVFADSTPGEMYANKYFASQLRLQYIF